MNRYLCYPITERIINNNESCDVRWKLLNLVGEEGSYGEVWSVCCNSECNYVLKYLPFELNKYENIVKEIEIQNECANLGLCPKIRDAWLCDTGGAIVMEIYEETVAQLLLRYTSDHDRQKIFTNILALTDKLHRHGIYHGDLHLNNIMVKSNNIASGDPLKENILKGDDYDSKKYTYYFIDFGKGGRFSDMSDVHIENDFVDIAAHLQDLIDEQPNDEGFVRLYELMKIYMTKFE